MAGFWIQTGKIPVWIFLAITCSRGVYMFFDSLSSRKPESGSAGSKNGSFSSLCVVHLSEICSTSLRNLLVHLSEIYWYTGTPLRNLLVHFSEICSTSLRNLLVHLSEIYWYTFPKFTGTPLRNLLVHFSEIYWYTSPNFVVHLSEIYWYTSPKIYGAL